ncbi:hypothetical protein M0220_13750 [Halomonas qinghailakensis]|uniref:Peptidase S24/S26A/S26B/S26C domain-containing protein n=2 Tax=Halomonas qinghailakensis TaxID=2937790 RepID=A0AA46YPR6_9GAMM|nr:hypothetical protein M0220_13750 [Halomonas sp. ZZQ-149]
MRSGILLRPTSGNSMIGGKIHHGDLLVVNGSRVIVIAVDRDLAVKRLILLSRNCALYGDMFHQVTEVLARFSPHAEVYSIY